MHAAMALADDGGANLVSLPMYDLPEVAVHNNVILEHLNSALKSSEIFATITEAGGAASASTLRDA